MTIVDKLYKIAISSLAGLTLVGAVGFSAQLFQYFTVVLPEREKLVTEKDISTSSEAASNIHMWAKFRTYMQSIKNYACSKALTNAYSYSTNSEKKRTWNVLRINHVAMVTGDLDKSVKLYRDVLGIKTSQPVPVPTHGVSTVFVELSNTKLELLVPLGEKSPIQNFLDKHKAGGMHHICLEVDNIENAIKDLRENEITMLSEKTKIGAHGKPVMFLHPKDCGGVLIELEEV